MKQNFPNSQVGNVLLTYMLRGHGNRWRDKNKRKTKNRKGGEQVRLTLICAAAVMASQHHG